MEATLFKLLGLSKSSSDEWKFLAEFCNDASGNIEIADGRRKESISKSLPELYGSGNVATVDPQGATFAPLFLAIEHEIAYYDINIRRLTDAEVALSLDTMSMNPEAPTADPLIQRLQCRLRIILSVQNYSRQEIRTAIRRIGRSVTRHTGSGRGRSYLNFIREYVWTG